MTAPDRDPVGRYADLLLLPMTETERTAIEALVQYGSQHKAAEALGWKRTKLQSRLRAVQARARAAADVRPEPPPQHGRVSVLPPNDPFPGAHRPECARYILTAAQNNTPVHAEFLANLEAYAEYLGARIMVSRFSYNKGAFAAKGSKPQRAPTAADTEGLWYDPAIAPYICDDPSRHGSCRWQLAPGPDGIVWCAEQNILPTATRPLSGLETYSGPPSAVFPHAKIAMEGTPVLAGRQPRFLYTTGAVTQRNYIQRKAGIKAEFHHAYGALLVEVDLCTGGWWVRQLNADDDGTFQDLLLEVREGQVLPGPRIEAIQPGDIHSVEIDPLVADVLWGNADTAGAIDHLQPKYQIWNDTFSMRSRSHHETKKWSSRYAKHCAGRARDSVEVEVQATAALLCRAHRDWCTTVVVPSNHDEHPDKWLDESDHRDDPVNAEFLCEGQLARMRAIRTARPWNWLKWATLERQPWPLEGVAANTGVYVALSAVLFLARDYPFYVGPESHPVAMHNHGDLGPDGARGTTANLTRVPVRISKGHSHVAAIRDGVTSAGVCQLKMDYARGPSSWSVSHVLVYASGKRCLLTQREGKLWL